MDPIDGTRSFAAGVPLYGVLLALEDGGRARCWAAATSPRCGQTLSRRRGAGAWLNGRALRRLRGGSPRQDARLVTSGLEYWRDWATDAGRAGLDALVRAHAASRAPGATAIGYCLVATGRAEIMVDPAVGSYWDYAALVPILAEAGARFTTLGGAPLAPGPRRSPATAARARGRDGRLRRPRRGGDGAAARSSSPGERRAA